MEVSQFETVPSLLDVYKNITENLIKKQTDGTAILIKVAFTSQSKN